MYSFENTFNKILFKNFKDVIDKLNKLNTIYRISCLSCNSIYIGETFRYLRVIIKENKRSVEKNENNLALAKYARSNSRNFDFYIENVKILNIEESSDRRLTNLYSLI